MILRDPSLRPGGGVIRSGHSRSHIYDPRKILTAGLPADEEENKLKQKLQAKLKNRKGFTLIEMLIVVAIIAILVAVSIPLVTSSLNEARVATDMANERAARAAASIMYLTEDVTQNTYYYDAVSGTLQENSDDIDGYGQCGDHKNGIVVVDIDADATDNDDIIEIHWMVGSTHKTPHGLDSNAEITNYNP